MKTTYSAILFGLLALVAPAQELSIQPGAEVWQLSWQRTFPKSSGVPSRLNYRLLTSPDLQNWVPSQSLIFDETTGDGLIQIGITPTGERQFFKLETGTSYLHRSSKSAPPAIYNQQYENTLLNKKDLTATEFAAGDNDPACLPQIGWDPTTAGYWIDFYTTPEDHNATLDPNDPERRRTNFKLNAAELEKYMQNGFVVSPRLSPDLVDAIDNRTTRPALPVDVYYNIWTDDLPVFITADSVLDAWHRTFLQMLEEIEEIYLYPTLRELLVGGYRGERLSPGGDCVMIPNTRRGLGLLTSLESIWSEADSPGAEHIRQAIADLHVYLGTASSLVVGYEPSPQTSDTQDPAHWYQAALVHGNPQKADLYGDAFRFEDMTLFEPRGHYTNSEVLRAYFRTILWLSRAQFQIAKEAPNAQTDRELRAASLLSLQVRDRGYLPLWQQIETVIQNFVGQSDAMTVLEMVALLESLSLDHVEDLASDANLATIRTALLASTYGIQEIGGGRALIDPDNCTTPNSLESPRALSLFGQRWTPDSWTFTNVVFPSVEENNTALYRRMPSALDVAYSVLSNDTARPILAERMADTNGVPFRDGYPYQKNLATLRSVLDGQQAEFWTEHSYGSWLYALRSLSEPLPATAPDTFRTTAWKRRMLNTQLVSWTQLRHDTLLYAEQSFTPGTICSFPDGYVDPYPNHWQRLADLAEQFRSAISPIIISGQFGIEQRGDVGGSLFCLPEWKPGRGFEHSDPYYVIDVDRSTRIGAMRTHLTKFTNHCLQLKAIAEAQLTGQPRTPEMTTFIQSTVENFSPGGGCSGDGRLYNGWFPGLYFLSAMADPEQHPSATWDPSVVDVHTDSPDTVCSGDPGGILHEGTGRIHLILVAVKHPDGTSCTYAGPVASHHEFIEPYPNRLNDADWSQRLSNRDTPPVDEWKLDYLVPAPR